MWGGGDGGYGWTAEAAAHSRNLLFMAAVVLLSSASVAVVMVTVAMVSAAVPGLDGIGRSVLNLYRASCIAC